MEVDDLQTNVKYIFNYGKEIDKAHRWYKVDGEDWKDETNDTIYTDIFINYRNIIRIFMLFTLFSKGNSSECWNFCSLVTKPFSCIGKEYQLVNGKCECMVNFIILLYYYFYIYSFHITAYIFIL